jgi:hypothetical protein
MELEVTLCRRSNHNMESSIERTLTSLQQSDRSVFSVWPCAENRPDMRGFVSGASCAFYIVIPEIYFHIRNGSYKIQKVEYGGERAQPGVHLWYYKHEFPSLSHVVREMQCLLLLFNVPLMAMDNGAARAVDTDRCLWRNPGHGIGECRGQWRAGSQRPILFGGTDALQWTQNGKSISSMKRLEQAWAPCSFRGGKKS